MASLFSIKSLTGTNNINFIGTYKGWSPLKWDSKTAVKIPFDLKGEPLIDELGRVGTISLEAHCLKEDKTKLDNYLKKYAVFTDPYGTYKVYVKELTYNTKEIPDLENIGLELIVVEVR